MRTFIYFLKELKRTFIPTYDKNNNYHWSPFQAISAFVILTVGVIGLFYFAIPIVKNFHLIGSLKLLFS